MWGSAVFLAVFFMAGAGRSGTRILDSLSCSNDATPLLDRHSIASYSYFAAKFVNRDDLRSKSIRLNMSRGCANGNAA